MSSNERKRGDRASTIITTHLNPDYDAVASMVAATKLYPEAVMLFPGGQPRNVKNFFIQSLLYLFDVVRPKDIDFDAVKRLVVVDTRQKDRIGVAGPYLANPNLDIHLYDHHPDAPGDLAGSLQVVSQVGANVTIMIELIKAQGLTLNPQEATMLALGLYEDTGSFTFSSTTPRDLAAAGFLLESGADLSIVSELISRELTAEQLALLNELIHSAEIRETRGRTVVVAMARREYHIEDVAVLAHKMMDILSADLLFVLVEMENMVQLVARSRLREADVGEIARALGGGGHGAAAAVAVRGKHLQEVREELEKHIAQTVNNLYSAAHIMVRNPISIGQNRPISEAMDMLVRFSLNVLLVEDSLERTIGILSEHSVSKAIYHGLTSYPVSDVMTTEFQTVPVTATFNEIKTIIVDLSQRILPVIDGDGRAIGVITRTDLLRLLAGEVPGGTEEAERGRGGPFERNLSGIMEDRIGSKIMGLLKELGDLAEKSKASVYLVGGTVRDLIMHKPIKDLDLTVTGDMLIFLGNVTEKLNPKQIKKHPRFKTATVILEDGARLDFSSARVEYYEYPGALPVVSQSSIQLDLQRRDFTINALALSLNAPDFGRLFDFYRGYQDIKEGLIRVLHSLSIIEDPTRAFRAVRFAARLGFKLSKMTLGLVESALKGGFFQNIHPRRLLTELKLICEEDEAVPALERLADLGLLGCIHPSMRLTRPQRELIGEIAKVKQWFQLTFGNRPSASFWLVYFLVLTEGLSIGELTVLVDNLDTGRKAANEVIHERARLWQILLINRRRKGGKDPTPSEVDRLLSPLSWPGILYIMAKARGDFLAQAGAAYLATYRKVKPQCRGDELIALGFPMGPTIQKVLCRLREARLDGLAETIDDERRLAKKMFEDQSV
ncbi:MAG: CBS domain-containing protein [Deltaproteobacteria bacterium]|jgi:tRNA nucleotidyltransferase (CCA-adding enzyme)|nr:CBS domain-containing protein [Deltaproteobacteria bacterium]